MSTISFMRRKYRFLFLNDKEIDNIFKETYGTVTLLVELASKSQKVFKVRNVQKKISGLGFCVQTRNPKQFYP